MTGDYWVIKYIEDLARQEPRNIGIVFRTGNRVLTRFIGEREPGGQLDLRTVRNVVQHTGTYKQWVDYWRYCIRDRDADDALRLLLASGKGNYFISDQARIALPDVTATQALSQLFHALVTGFPQERLEELSLTTRVADIIRDYELLASPHFQESPVVRCEIQPGIVEHVRPSYGWLNGHAIYFQRVSISANKPEPTQKDVHNAAWIFEKLRTAEPQAQTKALVKIVAAAEADAQQQTNEYLSLLVRLSSEVVNVDDDAAVDRTFRPLMPAVM